MKLSASSIFFFLLIIVGIQKTAGQPVVYEPYFERLYPFQPNVDLGGQAISLSVNPSNDNEVLAVTKTGGMMKTSDRGRSWRTLFGLPTHWVTYVRHAPMNPRLIIATTRNWDYNYTSQGGIWLSRDGGDSWVRPAITNPPAGRVEAYCIATYPGSSRIMVGTNLGLAISENNGETWTFQVVPGTSVGAVALMRGNAMIISTGSGIYLWNGFSRMWQQESTGIGMAFGPNSFCVPYQFMNNAESASPIFVTTGSEQIQFSNNGGLNWRIVDTIPAAINYFAGGTFFVKAAKNWFNDGFDLFCSNAWGMWRKHCPRTGSNFSVRFNERWNFIPFRHSDISDLTLDRTNEAYLMASDGGVQRYWRDILGDNFSFDDGGGKSSNGFHGLEITEIQGVYIASRRQHDLYFATQHNNLWGSENAGSTWPGVDGAEGFLIEAPRVAANESEVKLGYVTCADCHNKISNRLFRDPRYLVPSAPGSSCLKYLKPNTYLTFAGERLRTPGSIPYSTKYFLTENYTRPDISPSTLVQSQIFNVSYLVARDLPKRSGVPESHILYQAYKDYRERFLTDSVGGIDMASGPDDRNIQRVKLMRMYINFNRGGGVFASDRRFAAMRNFGSIGVFPTEFAWYEQFAPDPVYPNHLIAADAVNRQMMQSFNGGDDWDSMPALTHLITARGTKRFTQGRLTNTSCISFNPDYPQMILIGTRESGLFFSWNNGRDWQAIPGSDVIPEISSVFWQNNNTAIVSSYGRGLYKVFFMFRPARVRLADLFLNPVYTYIRPDIAPLLSSANNIPDSFRRYFDAAYMVTDGNIEDLTVKNDQVVKVVLTSNSSVLTYTDDKNLKQSFETVDWDPATMKAGFEGLEKLAAIKEKGYYITGLLFNKGKLVDVIYSKDPLAWPVKPVYKPLEPTGEKELNINGKRFMFVSSSSTVNGYCYIGKDRKLTLEGMNFPTDIPAPYKVLIDGQPVNSIKDFYPQKDGSFSFDVDLRGIKYGCHTITVYQYNKEKKRVSETDEFIIPNGDEVQEKQTDKKDR